MHSVPLSTVIDDRYEIVASLGSGGFGNVYKAWQKQFERPVALKILNPSVLEEADGLPRFEREARAISGMHHRNIVSFYGYGVWHGAPYMVLEFIAGASLQSRLRNGGRLDPIEAVDTIKQVCEGLACAHAHGLVHRDLKPSNIMLELGADGHQLIKLIDFGLAKLMPGNDIPSQKLTEAGCALGTSHYMSPEQCIGGQIDDRSDIYAVGCILYHCITGCLPFDADDAVAIMYKHINQQAKPLADFVPGNPTIDALQAVVERAMAKSPEERYQSAAEMARDLDSVLTGASGKLEQRGRTSQRMFLPTLVAKAAKKHAAWVVAIAVGIATGLIIGSNQFTADHDEFAVLPAASDGGALTLAEHMHLRAKNVIAQQAVDVAAINEALRLMQQERFIDAEKFVAESLQHPISDPEAKLNLQEFLAEARICTGKFAGPHDFYQETLNSGPTNRRKRCLIGLLRGALMQKHYGEGAYYMQQLDKALTRKEQDQFDIRILKLALAAGTEPAERVRAVTKALCKEKQPEDAHLLSILLGVDENICRDALVDAGCKDCAQQLAERFHIYEDGKI